MKLLPDVGKLRTKKKVQVIRNALREAREKHDTRIIHWSVQHDHIHFVCEPGSETALSTAMKGLAVRVAKGLNRLLGRKGTVFADRYHVHLLETPREVRNALAYVLNNTRRHEWQRGYALPADCLDLFSTAAWFDGWKDVGASELRRLRRREDPLDEPPLVHPVTWLLAAGWRKHGLISAAETPGATPRAARFA